ncbi:MAG: hypothetical protein RLW87_20445 [Alphaproteobacteria bacterium]
MFFSNRVFATLMRRGVDLSDGFSAREVNQLCRDLKSSGASIEEAADLLESLLHRDPDSLRRLFPRLSEHGKEIATIHMTDDLAADLVTIFKSTEVVQSADVEALAPLERLPQAEPPKKLRRRPKGGKRLSFTEVLIVLVLFTALLYAFL